VPAAGRTAADSPALPRSKNQAAPHHSLPAVFEAGLSAAAFLFFPVLVIVPRGTAALVSIAGVLGGGLVLACGRKLAPVFLGVPGLILAALVAWGGLSAAWGIDPPHALIQAARQGGLVAASLALVAATEALLAPRRLAAFLLGGFVAALAIAAFDLASNGALSKPFFADRIYQPAWLNQASVAFAILLLPTAALLIANRRRALALLFAAAAAATVAALAGTAAKVALVFGVPVTALVWWRRRAISAIAALLWIAVVLAAPFGFGRLDQISGMLHIADEVKLSAGHRLLIWSFVSSHIAERPLLGWGLDSSRAIPGATDVVRPYETMLPLHPHNAPLQLWLELGLPGAALLALLGAWLWLELASAPWPRLYAAAAGGSLATALVATTATYGIWQEWWQGSLAFALFIVLVMARVAATRAGSDTIVVEEP
jgi:exopolysaccharide production protein ExoQ